MDYIPTEIEAGSPGVSAEKEVWGALKEAFGPGDTGVAYYKFPVVNKQGDEFDREPDFVLLHRELGLLVIECKGYLIEHIDRIEGQVWYLDGISQDQARPYPQARDQGFHIRSYFNRKKALTDEQGRCNIPVNVFVALPNITRKEWEDRGFHELPSTPRTLTNDELAPQSLREKLFEAPNMDPLTEEQYRAARSVLGGGTVLGTPGAAAPPNPTTKGEIYQQVEEQLPKLDQKQEEIGIQIPPGPQQVRGIAGSGKTVLMAMKAARMHSKHPKWDIAVTFHTKSLYQHIRGLIRRFFYHFTEDEPNWNKLRLLHGWGGKTVLDGMYYVLAKNSDGKFLNVVEAQHRFGKMSPPNLLDYCAKDLRENAEIPEMFDAILIDEAQDFEKNFYMMCRDALREPKRLIWAYDEAQSLGNLEAPSPKNIFGTDDDGDPKVDLSGTYAGGIQKSQIMRRAYRSPREVLMTAHAFGMGLKRESGAVQAITTKEGWRSIGYKINEGDFRKIGEPVKITRPEEHSPHPIEDVEKAKPFVTFESFDSKREEMERVAALVERDIHEQNLAPEQVMVILLGYKTDKKAEKVARYFDDQLSNDITTNFVWNGNGDVFEKEGEVTVTRMHRAKGNEAAMVYLTGLEHVDDASSGSNLVKRRNEAFVGITRTRGWCSVTGVGENLDAFDEFRSILDEVSSDEPEIEFPAPDPQSLENEMETDTIMTTFDDYFDTIEPEIVDPEDV